jgi:2,2-dialkylglycine decarboxylase (pyruvate)
MTRTAAECWTRPGQLSAILGHSHPEVVAALREAAGGLGHLFSALVSEPVMGLAEMLSLNVSN